jgi:hypothetical protein
MDLQKIEQQEQRIQKIGKQLFQKAMGSSYYPNDMGFEQKVETIVHYKEFLEQLKILNRGQASAS